MLAKQAGFKGELDERMEPYLCVPWDRGSKWGNRLQFNKYVPSDNDAKAQLVRNQKNEAVQDATNPGAIRVYTDGSRHDNYIPGNPGPERPS